MPGRLSEIIRSVMLRPARREASDTMPHLGDLRSALVILNGYEDRWSTTLEAVQTWLRLNRILATIVYVDHRKKGSPVLLTPAFQTLSEGDFILSYIPNSKIRSVIRDSVDLLLCLTPYDSFVSEYLVSRCNARLKIGCAPFDHCQFDVVISDPDVLEKISLAPEDAPEGDGIPPFQVNGVQTFSNVCDYFSRLQK